MGTQISGMERELLRAVYQAAAASLMPIAGEPVQSAGDHPAALFVEESSIFMSGKLLPLAKFGNKATRVLSSLDRLQQQQSSVARVVRCLTGEN